MPWQRPTSPPPRCARGPFLSPRYAGGEDSMNYATESMNLANATSLSLRPPASWVESTMSTRL